MGLDNYAVYGTEHHKCPTDVSESNLLPDSLFEGIDLGHGMFSGQGSAFRGKRYDSWVQYATGMTLYEEIIDPDTVQAIADELRVSTTPEFFAAYVNEYDISFQEAQDLLKWFEIAAAEGATVIGWW